MGIPDTHTMSIHHYSQTYTAVAEESSDNNTEENLLPICTQVFWRAVLVNMEKKMQQCVSEYNLYKDFKEFVKATNTKIFTPAEIKKATRNYSKKNILGEGGYGTVFKGILPGNQLIAVKRPRGTESRYFVRGVINEIESLSQINNKNVVKLLGCCFETDVPSLVYEYIPNGSLYDHLFDDEKACLLTWKRRLTIAVQVAQVLDYLQNTIRVPIIHRDIKPSNILLNDKYIPIVADFGLSKFFLPDECEEFDTWESSDRVHTRVMGTYSYMDPEYAIKGVLTKKSDVYSFGALLAALLTRCCFLNINKIPYNDMPLIPIFFKILKEDRLLEILDEQLVNEESIEQLKKVADVAARCLQKKPEDRPSARQVARMLEDIMGI